MTRMGPILVSRKSGRRCPLGTFGGVCLVMTTFCFLLTFLTTRVQQSLGNARPLVELPSWPSNQSLELEDYVDTQNINTFIWQPREVMDRPTNVLPSFCGPGVKVLVLVTSAPKHFIQRQVIRETWGAEEELKPKLVKLFFALGRSQNDTEEEDVASEALRFGDILEEDFVDTYHNLTLKTASILKWINLTCFSSNLTTMPPHILKVDDDIFVNIDRLFDVIHQMPQAQMIGRLICGAEPINDKNSKLFMPQYLFPGRMYPGYLSGTAYVLTGGVVGPLLQTALNTPLIHMEDIFMTGIVARNAGIYPEDSAAFTYLKIGSKEMCVLKEMVSSHMIDPPEMREIWGHWRNSSLSDCASVLTPKVRQKVMRRPVPRVKNMSKRLKKLCQFKL